MENCAYLPDYLKSKGQWPLVDQLSMFGDVLRRQLASVAKATQKQYTNQILGQIKSIKDYEHKDYVSDFKDEVEAFRNKIVGFAE